MATIFVFGASIAFGAGDPQGGWVFRLRKNIDSQAENNSVSKNLVYNLGIPSETTVELLSRVDAEIKVRLRVNHTNVAIFSIGGNDAACVVNESRFRVPPDQFVDNVKRLVRIANLYCPIVLVQNLTPVVDSISGAHAGSARSKLNSYVDMYNDLLVSACDSSGAIVIDVHEQFTRLNPKSFLCNDGVHPNGRGHLLIARLVTSQLDYYLPEENLVKAGLL